MTKCFATFGSNQYLGALAKSYIVIFADEETAKKLMFEAFGNKWGFVYNEIDFAGQVERYGLTLLVMWDERGNVIGRGEA